MVWTRVQISLLLYTKIGLEDKMNMPRELPYPRCVTSYYFKHVYGSRPSRIHLYMVVLMIKCEPLSF